MALVVLHPPIISTPDKTNVCSNSNVDKLHKLHQAQQCVEECGLSSEAQAPQSATQAPPPHLADDLAESDRRRASHLERVQGAYNAWSRRMTTDPEFRAKAEAAVAHEAKQQYRAEREDADRAAGIVRPPTEYDEQKAVCRWLKAHHVIYAARSEGMYKDDVYRAMARKAAGMKAGLPDLEIYSIPPNDPGARGIGIEMKRAKGGVTSDKQIGWHEALRVCGWRVRVCHGADEAIAWLTELGFAEVRNG